MAKRKQNINHSIYSNINDVLPDTVGNHVFRIMQQICPDTVFWQIWANFSEIPAPLLEPTHNYMTNYKNLL